MKKLVDLETGREVNVPDMYVEQHYTGKRYEVRKGYTCGGDRVSLGNLTPQRTFFDTHRATVLLEKIEETNTVEEKKEEWREVTTAKGTELSGNKKQYVGVHHTQEKPFEAKLMVRDLPQPRPEIRVGDVLEWQDKYVVLNTDTSKDDSLLHLRTLTKCRVFELCNSHEKHFRDGKLIWSGE